MSTKTISPITILDIPIKYRMALVGRYNGSVLRCFCERDNSKAIGFSELNGEVVIIKECPDCFRKWYHHCRQMSSAKSYIHYLELKKKYL
jgi:hypothetical protein